MRTTATPIEDNKVQLVIEVEPDELTSAVDKTAQRLMREVSIKGFRKGKAPRQLIEARLGGPSAIRAQAINDSLPDFYARAISDALVDPIGQPELSISESDESEFKFEAVVEVRPEIDVTGYADLKIQIPSPLVTDDEVDAQINRLRETDAELREVDRPIVTGDIVLGDIRGVDPMGEEEDVAVDDFSFVVGAGSIAQGIDESIIGFKVGETFEATARTGPGKIRNYAINIKSIKERVLEPLTDEWAKDNTEYQTADEMREGIITQLRRRRLIEAQFARRDAAMEALAGLVDVELAPEALVQEEIQHRISDLQDRLLRSGISLDYFARMMAEQETDVGEQIHQDAIKAVRVDLALRGLVRALGLEPTDEEIDEEITKTAGSMNVTVERLRENLILGGRMSGFYSEVAKMKASRWLLENATYVDEEGIVIDKELLKSDEEQTSDE